MGQHVLAHVAFGGEGAFTDIALEGTLLGVTAVVYIKCTAAGEGLVANVAGGSGLAVIISGEIHAMKACEGGVAIEGAIAHAAAIAVALDILTDTVNGTCQTIQRSAFIEGIIIVSIEEGWWCSWRSGRHFVVFWWLMFIDIFWFTLLIIWGCESRFLILAW